jgi:polyisoprenyl-teichoic acid--peptidoglycan teichoic acid transferase
VLVLAAVVVTAGAVGFRSLGGGGTGAEEQFGPSVTQTPTTTLLAGTDAGGTEVAWLALLSYDPVAEKGAVVYVPAHTAVEVPGRGLQGMGDALATGGLPLLLVSAESFFGIEIDHYLELPRIRAQTLFEDLGALTVDVPNEVAVAEGKDTRRLLLTEGSQELNSFAIADLLYTIGDEGDDVELGARHLAFWDSILNGSNDPEELRAAFRNASVEAEASGNSGGADGNGLDLVASLAALEGVDLNLAILPARQVSVGGAELYATDNDEIAEFVSTTLPGVPVARNLAGVQVLNGNGSPGIGEKVAQKLVGKGFRIDLSGNADSFKYKKTKVISYDPSPAGQALAIKARDLLGVGEVQVSGQGQGSVDLTIIVGKDFLRTR